jgi:hypothetical protein
MSFTDIKQVYCACMDGEIDAETAARDIDDMIGGITRY